jgi:hypothetical protein
MKRPGWIVAAALVAVAAGAAHAGQVRLSIRGGLVTLDAQDATLGEILAEWARVGQTRFINAERTGGGPLTLQLTDVPERQALETLFRSSAGFIAAPRESPVPTLSAYDRIVVMPGVRPAAAAASAMPAPGRPSPAAGIRDALAIPAPPALVSADEDPIDDDTPQPPTPAGRAGQNPGAIIGAPYVPRGGQPPGAAAQPAEPLASSRPGVSTAPPQPIKSSQSR